MAENTKVRYLTDEQIATLKKTAGTNLVEAEELLKNAEEAKKNFDTLLSDMMKEYQALKAIYPKLVLGVKLPETFEWYQNLVEGIKDLKAAIDAAKDNNAYKHASNIETYNEKSEELIKAMVNIYEQIINNPLLKETSTNGVE